MSVFSDFGGQLAVLWAFVANTWWLWLPVVLGFAAWNLWKIYLAVRYFKSLPWVLLEVKIPRDIMKTPEAMEQVFAAFQGMYWEFDPWETYWQGLQHDYVVFELASLGGETRFFVRTPVFFRHLVESAVYAQYPEVEIVEADDYLGTLPPVVPDDQWDMFGVEFKLEREDAYPIRTYRDFLNLTAGQEEFEKVDPFSAVAEVFGKLRPGEHLGYHLILRPAQTPTPDAWRKKGEKLVEKLIGKKEAPQKGVIAEALGPLEPLSRGWGEPFKKIINAGSAEEVKPPKREERGEATLMQHLSPGTKDVVAAIERNIMKPGFETVVRMCYVARRDVFNMSHIAAFVGSLKGFNTQTLNAFKLNGKTVATKTVWWLPSFVTRGKKLHKKRLYYSYYRMRTPLTDTRSLKSEIIVLNTEELATIYHFPGRTAKAPMMPRIEARRSEPPATLPVG